MIPIIKKKLRRWLFIVGLIFITTADVNAQLNYDQAISYIAQSYKDLEGLTRKYNDEFTYKIEKTGVGTYDRDNKRMVVQYSRFFSDKTSDKIQYIFNPKHIQTITKQTEERNNGFHFAKVTLSGNLVLKVVVQPEAVETSENFLLVPYISGDIFAFERIKAAFFNLKSIALIRDSTDPFAN